MNVRSGALSRQSILPRTIRGYGRRASADPNPIFEFKTQECVTATALHPSQLPGYAPEAPVAGGNIILSSVRQ
jgi:hypothetical protein